MRLKNNGYVTLVGGLCKLMGIPQIADVNTMAGVLKAWEQQWIFTRTAVLSLIHQA